MRGFIHRVPEIDGALELRYVARDARKLQLHRFVGIIGQPARVEEVPRQRMAFHLDSMRAAPRRDLLRVGPAGLALRGFIRPPIERERRVIENRREAVGVLLVLLPKETPKGTASGAGAFSALFRSLGKVFRNPQSLLCGFISGLLFIPTTILGMTWGVRFVQEARGREFEAAVTLAAAIPLGWMIGCPLLGFISDRLGRRKPVIFGGALMLLAVLTWVLFGNPEILRGHTVGILMGIASGAAMLPYTVIKEANPPELGGTATGVVNFINFTFSALLSPVFGARLVEMPEGDTNLALAHYQAGFKPLLYGIVLALILTVFLRETGPAARKT